MRFPTFLAAAVMVLAGCLHGPDRSETTVTVTAASADVRANAMATLTRACARADLDPRATDARARACASGEHEACTAMGLSHLCGANGEENEAAALPMFAKACRLNDAEACRLLEATNVLVRRSGHVASLLD
jgi:hypothetical protein